MLQRRAAFIKRKAGGISRGESQKGFTIVEILLALTVFSVVILALGETYVIAQRYWVDSSRDISFQSAGRAAVEKIGTIIRRADDVSINDNASRTIMTADDVSGDLNIYSYEKSEEALYFENVPLSNMDTSGGKKITICHVPPGNTTNPQTLSVSVNALSAHLGHGDYVGACAGDATTNGNGGNSNGNGNNGNNSNNNGNSNGNGSSNSGSGTSGPKTVLLNVEPINGQPVFQTTGDRMVTLRFRLRDQVDSDGHQGRDFNLSSYWRN